MPSSRTRIAMTCAALAAFLTGASGSAVMAQPMPAHDQSISAGEERVIGGSDVLALAENPGAVALRSPTWELACTGVRIAPTWVLTARHCSERDPDNMPTLPDRIYTNTLRYGEGPSAKVIRRIVSPKGDLGLMELDSAPEGTIAKWGPTTPTQGESMRAFGWGRTGLNAPVSRQLRASTGSYVGTGTNALFRGGLDLRVRGTDGRPYKGDSGGPLLNAQGVVVAVVSWGDPNDGSRSAVVNYAAISQVADWIKTTTGTNPVP